MEGLNVGYWSDDELEHALQACDELLLLADALSAAIAAGDGDRLTKLLTRREELTVDLHLEYWDRSGAAETCDAAAVRTRPVKLIEKLQALARLDEENRVALERQLERIKAQLAELDHARQAIGQYAQHAPPPAPMFIDRRR